MGTPWFLVTFLRKHTNIFSSGRIFSGRGYLVTISVTVIGVVLSLAVSMMFGYSAFQKRAPRWKSDHVLGSVYYAF